ncbi:CpaD family pilus assembly lipoprotein [Budvicia diplopodorum]|uniref:CpaD family pilus assembly lipoprotein n=1 Tax=Budvicia diplopodorum TaxID=1119056 RepID=UPI001357F56D|nr:CpaD family pilus assembly lipoprotein [Budvicia diplopodorum]
MRHLWMLALLICAYSLGVQAQDQAYNSRFYASPEVEVQSFTLSGNTDIDSEILIGKVLHGLGTNRSSTITISWSKNNYKPVATKVRQELIKQGVAPHSINITQAVGGFNNQPQANLIVNIETVRLRAQRCNYNTQNYRYRETDDLGCALNNSLRRSLVNPMDFIF